MTIQLSRSFVSAMLLPAFFLSWPASAHPFNFANGDKPQMHRRATKAAKPLSTVIIAVIIIVVIVLVIALGGLIYIWYRRRSKSKSNKPVAMSTYGQPISDRPVSGSMRQEPNWWQPSADGHEAVSSQAHTGVPYSQGGHGYTYGTTLDPASAGVMGGTRTSATSHAPRPTEGEMNRPFQIPVRNSPPPPSITPSYHTYVGQESEQTRPPLAYNPPVNPPAGSFQPRPYPPANYIQPQATGTSMYSSPYEVTAMTQSTSGHPGT